MYNEGLIDFIKKYEGFRDKAYDDVGTPAIGYGSRFYFDLGDSKEYAVKMGDKIDEERANRLLLSYLDMATRKIKYKLPRFDLYPEGLKCALLDAVYNRGIGFLFNNKALTNKIKEAEKDNIFTNVELNDIALFMLPKDGDYSNLADRERRRALMAVGEYDFKYDNQTIGTSTKDGFPLTVSENGVKPKVDEYGNSLSFDEYMKLFNNGYIPKEYKEEEVGEKPIDIFTYLNVPDGTDVNLVKQILS